MIVFGIYDQRKLLLRPIKICGGSSNAVAEKFTAGQIKDIIDESINNVVLPAGAYYISARPTAYNSPVLFNGKPLILGQEYNRDARVNHTNCVQDFLRELTITANGNPYIITAVYPSDHPIDFSTIGF